MRLFDAVVLAELLWSSRARQVLLAETGSPPASGGSDQRRAQTPDVLQARLVARTAALGVELTKAQRRAERVVRQGVAAGCEALVFGDPDYPVRLTNVVDPPPVLWLRGQRARLAAVAVALVGSRACTPYAREVAEFLGSELSARGVTVVSGLARGVDAAAHRGGLAGPGGTIAVLGCGVDVNYPPEHAKLAAEITTHGGLLSELPPASPPRHFHFPRRNRLISGLSAAVVVIEAARRSGSLITARLGVEQGREVMAVPGNVLTGRNRGGHALIKDGAKVVETADDILEEIGGFDDAPSVRPEGSGSGGTSDPVLGLMEVGETYNLDALIALSGLGGVDLLSRLGELELAGCVRRVAGGRFTRLRERHGFGYIGWKEE